MSNEQSQLIRAATSFTLMMMGFDEQLDNRLQKLQQNKMLKCL